MFTMAQQTDVRKALFRNNGKVPECCGSTGAGRAKKKKKKRKKAGTADCFFFFISSRLGISTASYLEMDHSYLPLLLSAATSSAFARSMTEVSMEDR